MPSKWIEHVKEYAKSKGITYRDALKNPECKSSYKSKGSGLSSSKEENVSLKIEEKPRNAGALGSPVSFGSAGVPQEKAKRCRPKKYATTEEAKKAKSLKTMESNKRKKSKKSAESETDSEKEESNIVEDLVGKGILVAGYKTESDNGLTHIYPISHEHVLEILKRLQ
jgi:hypothetical protein